jgi:hypothetical protein
MTGGFALSTGLVGFNPLEEVGEMGGGRVAGGVGEGERTVVPSAAGLTTVLIFGAGDMPDMPRDSTGMGILGSSDNGSAGGTGGAETSGSATVGRFWRK